MNNTIFEMSGSSANAVLHPYHAVIVGVIAALLSVIGHAWISVCLLFLSKTF